MNRKSIRALMLGAMLVAMFATMASSAGASTWRSTGGSFSATAGSGTLDVGASRLVCASATATGSVAGTTGPVLPAAWSPAVTGTVRFLSCTQPVPGLTVHCNYSLIASSTTAANDVSGTTTGTAVVHCILYAGANQCRTIGGSVGGTYTNPTATGGTGRLNLNDSTALTSVTIGSLGCALPTGAARYTGGSFHIASGAPSIWAS